MTKGKVLVTGGAGFIGSYVVDILLEQGFEVRILDNLEPQVHGDESVDSEGWPLYVSREAERICGDIRDKAMVLECLKGVTHVAHLAAMVGVGQSMVQIERYTDVNERGGAVVLEAIKDSKNVQRMVVASSISIYGEGYYTLPDGSRIAPSERSAEQLAAHQWEPEYKGQILQAAPTTEDKPLNPTSVYAINKQVHEQMFLVLGKALNIPTMALRFFNAYGPRQSLSNPYTGVAAIFASRLMNNQSPIIYEDGQQRRDFIHVSDVARAVVAALDSSLQVWKPYNVGTGSYVTIAYIAQYLAKLLEKNIEPTLSGQYRVGDIRHCYSDSSLIARDLGFKAQLSFDEGMKDLVAWLGDQKAVDRVDESLNLLRASGMIK
ncbi:MAG: GDP-mannose 4,6-dehydratase [Chloroflexi bacterium]|nr:GDP-mannose 4,6-dehydratase [Chloroflexota bacterium]MCC6894872.1 GDP-mannose 4,6-dehydratase [Anaerolineae bacterium]